MKTGDENIYVLFIMPIKMLSKTYKCPSKGLTPGEHDEKGFQMTYRNVLNSSLSSSECSLSKYRFPRCVNSQLAQQREHKARAKKHYIVQQ